MSSKPRFAFVVVLTRNSMLHAYLFKRFFDGLGASGFHVLMALPDAFNGLLKILTLPFQILGQSFIKGGGRVLPTTLRVFFELGLAFRFDGITSTPFTVGAATVSAKCILPYPLINKSPADLCKCGLPLGSKAQ